MNPAKHSKPADLSKCAEEPIHIPGAVQAHGALLAIMPANLEIVQASGNVETHFGLCVSELVGHSAIKLIGEKQLKEILGSYSSTPQGFPQIFNIKINSYQQTKVFDVLVHDSEGLLIFEFLPAQDHSLIDKREFFRESYTSISKTLSCSNREELFQAAAQHIRELSGFDRVMIYMFDPESNGTVVAESRTDGAESYLHRRFPASDIPPQALLLYKKNHFRLLADANAQPSAIHPACNPLTQKPLDLSHSVLRSMSPVHLEYLSNMNVKASMSFSLVLKDELLGLIACHHSKPKTIGYQSLVSCDFLAKILTLKLNELNERDNYQNLQSLQESKKDFLKILSDSEELGKGIIDNPYLLDLVKARGAAYISDSEILSCGLCPSTEEIGNLLAWLNAMSDNLLFNTDSISNVFPEAASYKHMASGVLAMRISSASNRWLIWFRPEQIQEIYWAGEPSKSVEIDDNLRIHPRKSFEKWKQLVRGKSLPWTNCDLKVAMELRGELLDRVITVSEKTRSESLQKQVIQLIELNLQLESLSAELLKNKDAAIEASKRKSEILSIVSHDIRSPLTSIHGSLALLAADSFNKSPIESKELIELALGSSEFLISLINGLLDLDSIESGSRPICMTEFPVETLIKKALEIVTTNALKKEIQFVHSPTKLTAYADETYSLQILVNLISNAIKFSEPSCIVEISAEESNSDITIKVKDYGRGVPEAYRQKIFERFSQVEPEDRTVKGGTGLGLAICKALAEAQGGEIGLDSEQEKGSTFWLKLKKNIKHG